MKVLIQTSFLYQLLLIKVFAVPLTPLLLDRLRKFSPNQTLIDPNIKFSLLEKKEPLGLLDHSQIASKLPSLKFKCHTIIQLSWPWLSMYQLSVTMLIKSLFCITNSRTPPHIIQDKWNSYQERDSLNQWLSLNCTTRLFQIRILLILPSMNFI